MQTLKDYIESHHNGSQSDFAKAKGITKQQANEWIKHGGYYIDSDGWIYIRKRQLTDNDNNAIH